MDAKRGPLGEKGSPLMMRLTYLYLAIPILIFIIGWFHPVLAVIFTAVTVCGLWLALRTAPSIELPAIQKKDLWKVVLVVLMAAVWVFFSGIGQFSFQNTDHSCRNAMLRGLVERPWPVTAENASAPGSEPRALVYYIAFWLPAACVGKVFGLRAAHTFLYLWAVLGVLLTFALILSFSRKFSPLPLVIFVFFSGLDILGVEIYNLYSGVFSLPGPLDHLEWWSNKVIQYSSMTTQLYWVFNQALPAWLVTLAILRQKDNRSLVFLYSLSLLHSTLPAIGLLPIAAYMFIRRCLQQRNPQLSPGQNLRAMCREAFTFQNFFAGGAVGITSFLYLKTNLSGQHVSGLAQSGLFSGHSILHYGLFLVCEVLLYFLVIFPKNRKNGLYYLSLAILLVCPFIRVGYGGDFCMRASIPALVILFLLVSDTLRSCLENRQRLTAVLLSVLLLVGAVTPLHEMLRSVYYTAKDLTDPNYSALAPEDDLFTQGSGENFFGEQEGSFFFQYIAK